MRIVEGLVEVQLGLDDSSIGEGWAEVRSRNVDLEGDCLVRSSDDQDLKNAEYDFNGKMRVKVNGDWSYAR